MTGKRTMNRIRETVWLRGTACLIAVGGLVACSSTQTRDGREAGAARDAYVAVAMLEPRSGANVGGKVVFNEREDGIWATIQVRNAPPGWHGLHIHEHGDCSAPDAISAGDHYNPTGERHGAPNTVEHHVGDLGNLFVAKNGVGTKSVLLARKGTENFDHLKEIRGKSVILHSEKDDFTSQPAGDSGKRIACGVLESPPAVSAE